RLFGSEKLKTFMEKLGLPEGEPLEHPWLNKAIEQAQKKVEAYHFDIRKHLLEYDDVMNKQRETIYSQRKEILKSESIRDWIISMVEETVQELGDLHLTEERNFTPETLEPLITNFKEIFNFQPSLTEIKTKTEITNFLRQEALKVYETREKTFGPDLMRNLEKYFLLTTIDTLWKEHLLLLDQVKEAVGLRGYGQKNPLQEYKKEAFQLFVELMRKIRITTLSYLYRVEIKEEAEKIEQMVLEEGEIDEEKLQYKREDLFEDKSTAGEKPQPIRAQKIGRNDPCPCGSGKKYKKCCGSHLEENYESREQA
ncbi:MAG: SEC-C metal-binding domain-containing protein, partial [Caldimicrobium sp.]